MKGSLFLCSVSIILCCVLYTVVLLTDLRPRWIRRTVAYRTVLLNKGQEVNWTCNSNEWMLDAPLDSCGLGNPHVSWGYENIQVVTDPLGIKGNVLRITYPENSGAYDRSNKGGINFKASPWVEADDLNLEYDIMFSDNFNWVKGGKLPGFYGGSGRCSGCRHYSSCFSSRFMWRRNGDIEIYAYIKNDKDREFCEDDPKVVCNKACGDSFGRYTARLTPGRWYRIAQRVKLNDPGERNGRFHLYVDGEEYYRREDLTLRTDQSIKVSHLSFSTFFGGGHSSWATPDTVYIYVTNFHVYN